MNDELKHMATIVFGVCFVLGLILCVLWLPYTNMMREAELKAQCKDMGGEFIFGGYGAHECYIQSEAKLCEYHREWLCETKEVIKK